MSWRGIIQPGASGAILRPVISQSVLEHSIVSQTKKHWGPGRKKKDYPSRVQGSGVEILRGGRARCEPQRLHFSPGLAVKSSPDGTGNCVAVSETAQREM